MAENIRVKQLEPLFPAVKHRDFRSLLEYVDKAYSEDDAFIIKEKKAGRRSSAEKDDEPAYRHVTYHELRQENEWFGTGLKNRGLGGRKVAVIAENCYEWMLVYMAVPMGGGITVPLDKGLPYDEALWSLRRSGAEVLVFDKTHRKIAEQLKAEMEAEQSAGPEAADADPEGPLRIRAFFSTTELEGYESCRTLIEEGRQACEAGDDEYWKTPIDPNGVSLILFTSGTSGRAKAVMLSQYNVLSNVYAMERTQDIRHGDINMAFLPFHHTFGCDTQVMMYACGVTTVFCDGLRYIQKNMCEYHVTIFIGVPLLIEAIYKRVMREAEKQGKLDTLKKGMRISGMLRKFHIDVRRRMFKDVIEQLGGALRFVFSGASALDPETVRGFEAMGISVVQGYGMTEASPVIATEDAKARRAGSIGKALYTVEVELKDPNEEGIGEIICRAPNVMLGYYKEPEETAKTIVDGWLQTGDLARMDKDGFLFITGRKKNVIVLKNGKNVYPEEIETLIADLPYVKENILIGVPKRESGGSGELALCAKIVYDPEYMREKYGAEDQEAVEAIIWKDLEVINKGMPAYKQITRLIAQDKEMVKTTTGKVKRFQEGASAHAE